jgi:hypothetical protein
MSGGTISREEEGGGTDDARFVGFLVGAGVWLGRIQLVPRKKILEERTYRCGHRRSLAIYSHADFE